MHFRREILQTLKTIVSAGRGQEVEIEIPQKTDPLSGIPVGASDFYKIPFVVVSYSREDFADPSLATGLVKILLCPADKQGNEIPNFTKIVENKNATVKFPDGSELKILQSKTTKPDGITPILTRAFLGG